MSGVGKVCFVVLRLIHVQLHALDGVVCAGLTHAAAAQRCTEGGGR